MDRPQEPNLFFEKGRHYSETKKSLWVCEYGDDGGFIQCWGYINRTSDGSYCLVSNKSSYRLNILKEITWMVWAMNYVYGKYAREIDGRIVECLQRKPMTVVDLYNALNDQNETDYGELVGAMNNLERSSIVRQKGIMKHKLVSQFDWNTKPSTMSKRP